MLFLAMPYSLQLYRKQLVWWLLWIGSGLVVQPVCAQISFRLVLDQDEITYKVYLTSTASYSGNQSIIPTAQVTLSVPHGTGNDRFLVTNLTSAVPRMRWVQSDRADAPVENPDRDYLFFSFTNDATPLVQFPIVAGQDVLLFTFQRKGNCLGRADLMNNTADPFRTPNSLGINVGNSLSLLGTRGDAYRDSPSQAPSAHIQVRSDSICSGQVLSLSAVVSTPGASPTSTYKYQWYKGDKSIGPPANEPVLSYTLTNSTSTERAIFKVQITLANEPLCQSPLLTATRTITVKPAPSAVIQYTGDPCAELPVHLTVTPVVGTTYQWLRDTINLPGQNSPELLVEQPGHYSVKLSRNGCFTSSASVWIAGGGPVTIQFKSISPIIEGTGIKLDPQISNADSVSWMPPNGLSSTSVHDPVATPTTTTTYTLTAWSTQGCLVSDSITIRVFQSLYIPTAFTPNGDGVNDRWEIRNTQVYDYCQVRVFDRWGELIFSSTDYTTPWDGQTKGELVEAGTYLYQIQTPLAVYQGEFTLIR